MSLSARVEPAVIAASPSIWDAVVVGAGPAGSLAAHGLAGHGLDVLLVDRAEFPRAKVCGSCLNARALGLLRDAGLAACLAKRGAVALHSLLLAGLGGKAYLRLPPGAALSRAALDDELAAAAVRKGARFLPGTQATLGPVLRDGRVVRLSRVEETHDVRTRLVLAADGLSGRLVHGQRGRPAAAADSRIGAGVLVENAPAFFAGGTIHMACDSGGYVGMVRIEDGRLDIAAALDPRRVRCAGGPGRLAAEIISRAGLPQVPHLETVAWRGTPPLRRLAPLSAERVLVLGDAAGYIEPFTGEGIAWALECAEAIVPITLRAVRAWDAAIEVDWQNVYRHRIARRQAPCRWLAALLRHPLLTRGMIEVLGRVPAVAGPLLRWMNQPVNRN
jgi:flavin-dependent dehydrogenase